MWTESDSIMFRMANGDTTDASIGCHPRGTRDWPQCGTVKRRGDAGWGEEKGGVLGGTPHTRKLAGHYPETPNDGSTRVRGGLNRGCGIFILLG